MKKMIFILTDSHTHKNIVVWANNKKEAINTIKSNDESINLTHLKLIGVIADPSNIIVW